MSVRVLASLLLFSLLAWGPLMGDEPPALAPKESSLTAEEQQLVALFNEMQSAFDKHNEAAEKIPEGPERWKYHVVHYPDRVFIPRLLEFEKQYAGSRSGLMALRKIVLLCGSGVPYPGESPWLEVVRRLPTYLDREESVELIRRVDANAYDPKLEEPLRMLAESPAANPVCHEYVELMLASWMLSIRNQHEYLVRRIAELDAGEKELYFESRQNLVERLEALPTDDADYQRYEKEASAILTEIVARNSPHRRPVVKNVDPDWHIIARDDSKTELMPKISEIAAGVLFKENHLRIGKLAPNLDVKLTSGSDWSLASQRGKVVIIQFSFTGCGPCESMYPDMKVLRTEVGDKLSILTIMADEDRADTEEAVSSGKLPWNVCWDSGDRGPIVTQWGVKSFPTVYVIDKFGQVAAFGLRYDDLNRKVRALSAIESVTQ